MKNISRWIVNLIWWFAVTFVVVLAAIVVSVKQLLPLADHYRPQIESNISQIIGLPVKIESFGGGLNGIDVSINVSHLNITSNDGDDVISVGNIAVSLDTVKSLLTFSPQFRSVHVDGLSVFLEESKNGIGLVGLHSQGGADPSVVAERVIDYLSTQKQWVISESKITLKGARFDDQMIKIPSLIIRDYSDQTMGEAEVYVNGQITPIKLKARIKKTYAGFGSGHVDVYAKVPDQVASLEWLQSARLAFLEGIKVGGEVWLSYIPEESWSFRLLPNNLVLTETEGAKLELQGDIYGQYRYASDNFHLNASTLTPHFSGFSSLPTTNLTFDYDLQAQRALLLFDEIDAKFASEIGLKFLPEQWVASKLIKGLSGQGQLKNASLRVWGDRHQHFQYVSNLENISVEGFRGIPKVDKLDAIFSIGEAGGYIQYQGLHSDLQFNEVYDNSWKTESLDGLVEWRTNGKQTTVVGTDLSVNRNGARIGGEFRLEVRPDAEDWLVLNISAQDIETADRLDYIPPRVLSNELKGWIKNALSNGKIADLGVIVQTSLQNADPQIRIALQTEDVDVKFSEEWPVAHNTNASLVVQNDAVNVSVESTKFADLDVSNLTVSVPISSGKARWINVEGSLKDDADKVLTSLRVTPLNDSVLRAFNDWKLRGQIEGEFSVSVPLALGSEPVVDVDLSFSDNPIYVGEAHLEGEIVDGQLSFSTKEGLHDTRFVVRALGGESKVSLKSEYVRNGELAVIGELEGHYNAKDLATWRALPESVIGKIQGDGRYLGSLTINKTQREQIELDIRSSIDDVGLSLPYPMFKRLGDASEARVGLKFHRDDVVIDVNYDDFLAAKIALSENELVGGYLEVGRQSEQIELKKGVYVRGNLSKINIPDWNALISDIEADVSSDSTNEVAIRLMPPKWLKGMDVVVDEVIVNDLNSLNNVKVEYGVSSSDGAVYVNSDELELKLFANEHGPVVHFGFLSWNTSKDSPDEVAEEHKGSFLTANQVPNMTLMLDELYLNDRPLGDWNLKINRLGKGRVKISPILTQLEHGNIQGSLYWQEIGEDSSVELALKLDGKKAEEITRKFSDVPFIKSDEYQFDVVLAWQGTPFEFDRESLSGRIKFEIEDGNFNQVDQLPPFLKVLGIFNIDTLARRLTFDFSDLYAPGLPFDTFKGLLTINNGQLETTEPIVVSAPTAEIELKGTANLIEELLDERLTITVPISSTLPIAGFLLATPQIAGLLFITDKLIGKQISKVTSVQYSIVGPFSDPNVEPVKFKPN
ncbi:YhdP family protein [Marinomonas balearica]|uniref:Uncharacterized protein (TIGR02099 family) n=1 Tax=Marinomonas balearica TaxID=491947 RepID=A0A4R6MDR4_9GAMM|nr:YhdP family protein [Marinomonas balearica]TDO99878.1 uncharacterized protein (TIGR02099 family) [Marinomonas balearica]